MPARFTSASCAALLVALSVGASMPAHAQLGKLKKMGADAAKDAAMGKKPEDPTAARVTYDITADRLSAVVTALTPLMAAAQREADAKAVSVAYETKFKAANDCLSKAATGMPDLSGVQSPKYEALGKQITAVGNRLQTATTAKRYREQVALQDTAIVLQLQMGGMLFKNNCPAVPYRPIAMIDEQAAKLSQMSTNNGDTSSEIVVAPDARAGMTTGQWGRVRERIAAWLLIQSGDLPKTAEKFTDAEQSVMSARAAELKKFGPLFKSGSMQWVTWGDVKTW